MTYRYFLAGLLLAAGCGEPISGEGGYAGDDEPFDLLTGGVLAGDQVIDWPSDACSGSVSATGNRLGQVAEEGGARFAKRFAARDAEREKRADRRHGRGHAEC